MPVPTGCRRSGTQEGDRCSSAIATLRDMVPSLIEGSIRLHRVSRFAFPIEELAGPDGPIAHLGRNSSLNIFFGRGRRVRFIDGTEWRIKAGSFAQFIVPIVSSPVGTVATSGPLHAKRSYGINTKDGSYALFPVRYVEGRRSALWILSRYELEVATIDAGDRVLTAGEPLPVAAALLAFTLISHGIPGEAKLVP